MLGKVYGERRRGKPRRNKLDDVNDINAPTVEDFTDNTAGRKKFREVDQE